MTEFQELKEEIIKMGSIVSRRLAVVEENDEIIKENQLKLVRIIERLINEPGTRSSK